MKKRLKKIGTAPGAITFTGEQKVRKIGLNYLEYNQSVFNEESVEKETITDFHSPDDKLIQWYDIWGLHDIHLIEEIGNLFNIHPLVREDIADTHQRPKYEEYAKGIVLILKALKFEKERKIIKAEQVTLYFSEGFLLSFQEDDDDLFATVRKRLELPHSRVRDKKVDFLAFALIDSIVDNYYLVLDGIEDFIEELEVDILNNSNENNKSHVHHLKQEMLVMRKSIMPLREAINRFIKTENTLLSDDTGLFLRDLYNNVVQITDAIDTYRDMLSGLQDLYMSEISFRMNNVMQILTVITIIFVPLTFLAGIYGMNFINMPELQFKYGYYILMLVMVIISCLQIVYFKKKKWL